jgi:DNA-binding response OmpR family regulator/anti-anti-sigma regulatory factor
MNDAGEREREREREREQRARILIADDEPVNLDVLFNTLTADDDLEIIAANNGRMVLELVEEDRPDLILLDAMMPIMDGFATCKALKANASTADIPVIFITALTETAHKVEAFQAGAMDFITKPFDRMELLARLRVHLTLQRTMRALVEKHARLEEQIRQRIAAESAKIGLEKVIKAQEERLLELSTPLIPISESILAIPLIGTLDADRAPRIIETALVGASRSQAKFVIVDVTGVRAADAGAVSMFKRLADGLRLLGRRMLLTGISAEMAQRFSALDIALAGIVTRATLESGIRHALEASHGSKPM